MIGNHPDIESALRTGYREGMDLSLKTCPCCFGDIFEDEIIETDCGLKVCKDCLELCDGCKEKNSCVVSEL